MKSKLYTLIVLLLAVPVLYSQRLDFNFGVANDILKQVNPITSNDTLFKTQDNCFDFKYTIKKSKKKYSYWSIGVMNRSDNFGINVYNGSNFLYPKHTIEYKNRVTTIYGALRRQRSVFNSRFWKANQIGLGINFYRMENKQYLHPRDNAYMQTGTGPYFLEVIHKSHLKLNLRYEFSFGYDISSKMSVYLNGSIFFPTETNYKITTNTSLYGDYFEGFFTSDEFSSVERVFIMQYQFGFGLQYKLSPNEKK